MTASSPAQFNPIRLAPADPTAGGDTGAELYRARLYLDFDSFFASAEQHFNPQLRGKPVGVVPVDMAGTSCIAVSREAKALGVPGSAKLREARAIAPDMIFVVARPDAYVRLHHRIMEVIEGCLPIETVRSIDELVCELDAQQSRNPEPLAHAIKRALASEFSEALTCSIGIGPSELVAKIAAEMRKPDGMVVIKQADLPAAIAHLPLKDIPGLSEGMCARLEKARICDVPSLWSIDRKHARALWGSIEGERFWNAMHGLPFDRPETKKGMFGHSRILPWDWRSPEKVHECARQLLLSAARRLRRAEMRSGRMSFSVKGDAYSRRREAQKNGRRLSLEAVFEPACDDITLLAELDRLIDQYRQQARFAPRSVGVVLHGLSERVARQGDLFAQMGNDPAEAVHPAERRKRERLSSALDNLRSAHGPKAASLGPQKSMPGGYVGAKIVFGRIPDLADFSESATADHETQFCTV